jgi:DNA topoisomerase III
MFEMFYYVFMFSCLILLILGTDATIAEHIKKVLEREYANKEQGFFLPTTLGMGLVQGYRNMDLQLSLSKPFMRSQV